MILHAVRTAKAAWSRQKAVNEQYSAVKQYVRAPKGGRLLDIGVGGDTMLQMLGDKELALYGVDISAADRKRSIDEIALQGMASIYELPYNDSFFDCVTTVDTPDLWEDNKAAFREILRVLKSGGQILCAFSFSDDNGRGTPPRTLRAEARAAGFVNVSVKILRAEGKYLLTGEKPC